MRAQIYVNLLARILNQVEVYVCELDRRCVWWRRELVHIRRSSKVETENCPTRMPLANPRGAEGYLTWWVIPERRRLLPHYDSSFIDYLLASLYSGEIESFAENNLCNLGVVRRSRVLPGVWPPVLHYFAAQEASMHSLLGSRYGCRQTTTPASPDPKAFSSAKQRMQDVWIAFVYQV